MIECIVCWNETKDFLQPCNHYVCKSCIYKWLQRAHITCPLCRQVICALSPNYSFSNKIIEISNDSHLGVTVADCKEGVVIRQINKRDEAYKHGLRKGMKIRNINGISSKDIGHNNVAQQLTFAAHHKISVRLDLCEEIYLPGCMKACSVRVYEPWYRSRS